MGRLVEPGVTDPQSDDSLDALISLASASAGWTEKDARYLINKIERLEAAGTWPRRLQGEPKTWERFCAEVLGYEAGYVEKIREGLTLLKAVGIEQPTARAALEAAFEARDLLPEGRVGAAIKSNYDYIIVNRCGTSAEYLTARIKRDRPDILERMKSGEFKSVRAAAKEAGIVKERITLLKEPHAAAAALKRHFNEGEIAEIVRLLHWEKE